MESSHTLVSSFIGLAYEVYIVSFNIKGTMPYTKLSMLWIIKPTFNITSLMKLDKTMLMYGIYNVENIRKVN